MPPDNQEPECMSIDHDIQDGDKTASLDATAESSDDEETQDHDSWATFEFTGKRMTHSLHLRSQYSDWIPKEAFRELIQNWRDAIIESNAITPKNLYVHRQQVRARRSTEIVYRAFKRGTDYNDVEQCLGFIRYEGYDGAGTVDLVNRRSILQPRDLDIGATSKRDDEDQAGTHGEGLKLAALVLMRRPQNNHLSCRTGGYNWSFNFDNRGSLFVTMTLIKMNRKKELVRTYKIATPEVLAHRDVHFTIGKRKKGRDDQGIEIKRVPVQQTAFETWTQTALFLPQADNEDWDSKLISTYHGDLLTAENLRGSIFLKDLLLEESTQSESASLTGRPLWFGYNFTKGDTSRDRTSVATASEEAKAMCEILSDAMQKKPEMIGTLVDILNNTETEYADVTCAEKHWPRDVCHLIKNYLLRDEFANRWLYCGKNPRLRQIIEDIGRDPYEISNKCWNILEKKRLVRTVGEEVLWRFRHSEEVSGPIPSFGTSVSRLLRACIRACPQAVEMEIKFMQAGQLGLDIAISEDKHSLRIHERWIAMKDAVAELGLSGRMAEDKVVILAVKDLFIKTLWQMPAETFEQKGSARSSKWHVQREVNRAEERLINSQEMKVRAINKTDNGSPALSVEWAVNAGQQDIDMIEVQCHRASRCFDLRHEMLIAKDAMRQKRDCFPPEIGPGSDVQVSNPQPPTCRIRHVPFKQGMHYEFGLEEGEEYFFVLSTPTDPNSFVSMSKIERVSTQPNAPPNPAASASAGPTDPNGALRRPAHATDMEGEMSIVVMGSESPEPMTGLNSPDFAHNGAGRPSAASGSSNQRVPKIVTRAFSLDEPLQSLDLWKVDTTRLYKAGNSRNVDAFIGFMKGEPDHPEEKARKRRRVN